LEDLNGGAGSNDETPSDKPSRSRRFAARVITVVLICYFAFLSGALSQIDSHRSGVVLKASSTINTGVSVDLNAIPGLPINFTIEIIPIGGTVSVEMDGDLVVSWDRGQVSAGDFVDLFTRFAPNPDTTYIGKTRLAFGYLVSPGYSIDFNDTFHNVSEWWGKDTPELRDYIIDGVREGKIPLGDTPTPAVEHELINFIDSTVDSLFLLSDSLVVSETVVDTLHLSYSFTPYPCIRYEVEAQLRTTAAFTVGFGDICLRYAPPEDTLCWAVDTVVTCQSIYSLQQQFTGEIPCSAVKDWVVPFCPVEASGYARVNVGSALDILRLELHYTCDPPGPKERGDIPAIENSSLIQVDSLWLNEHRVDLKTDRDDMIFTIPVPQDDVVAWIEHDGDSLLQADSVVVGEDYTIRWTPLDVAYEQCCAGLEGVRLVYRSAEADHGETEDACFEDVDASTDNDGEFVWTPTTISCATEGQQFILFLEFVCNSSGDILYRTRTDWFKYFP
jgi:hypothetical protein